MVGAERGSPRPVHRKHHRVAHGKRALLDHGVVDVQAVRLPAGVGYARAAALGRDDVPVSPTCPPASA